MGRRWWLVQSGGHGMPYPKYSVFPRDGVVAGVTQQSSDRSTNSQANEKNSLTSREDVGMKPIGL